MILLKWVFNTFTLILLILTLIDLSWQQQDEFLDSTAKHLFWFVQVTDLHISHYGHETRLSDFKQFINEIIIKLIKPAVVIASGDLVHNLDRTFDSRQYESEWIRYQQVLLETNVTQHTKWLDIRGNHDVFMDAEPESSKSFYRQYSQQGRLHSSSYQYTLKTSDGDQYSFVGIDMCPKPAPGIAMNFFGHLTKSEMRHLEQLTKEIHHSNVTIYFGHYPLSFTYSSKVQEKIMRNGLVYLNGHLHAGIPHLYAHHSSGLLELELADWKQHRRFRLVTIDSGLLAFRDFQFNNQKLIYAVITHPKESRFRTVREPLARLKQRTHIRILIFSHHPILTVHVTIDSDFIGNAVQSVDNLQLFVLKWNPTKYDDDKDHKMIVQIKDIENNAEELREEFSLSTKIRKSQWWKRSQLVLIVHQPTFARTLLVLSLCFYLLTLILFRYYLRKRRLFLCCYCLHKRLTALCSIDLTFYSLVGFTLYFFVGPWYIGYLTDGYLGAVFMWGLVIKGIYIKPDMPFIITKLFLCLFPYTFAISSCVYHRYQQLQSQQSKLSVSQSFRAKCCRFPYRYLIFGWSISFLIGWSVMVTRAYRFGWLLSPFGLMLVIAAAYLFYKAHVLQMKDFRRIGEKNRSLPEQLALSA